MTHTRRGSFTPRTEKDGDSSSSSSSNRRRRFGARSRQRSIVSIFIAFLILILPLVVFGQMHSEPVTANPVDNSTPAALKDVAIEQRLNQQLPLDVTLKDEMGQSVRLGKYFGQRPVVLALVYYECPMLCNEVLNGMLGSLKALSFDAGRDFDVVAVSFDARENEKPGLAAEKKQSFVDRYNRPGASGGWHFLTGDEAAIKRVTDAAGFHFAYDTKTNQFVHASAIMLTTPDGKLSRYFYGVEYAPKDMKLGLIESSNGKIGSPVDALLLYCYHYDPAVGSYTSRITIGLIQAAGVIFLIALALFYFVMWRRKQALGEGRALGGAA